MLSKTPHGIFTMSVHYHSRLQETRIKKIHTYMTIATNRFLFKSYRLQKPGQFADGDRHFRAAYVKPLRNASKMAQ